jgi:hypothetical protein
LFIIDTLTYNAMECMSLNSVVGSSLTSKYQTRLKRLVNVGEIYINYKVKNVLFIIIDTPLIMLLGVCLIAY